VRRNNWRGDEHETEMSKRMLVETEMSKRMLVDLCRTPIRFFFSSGLLKIADQHKKRPLIERPFCLSRNSPTKQVAKGPSRS
jgi:hypothetical protein